MNANNQTPPRDESAPRPEPDGQEDSASLAKKTERHPNQPLPHVGAPLDGSQYLEVLEEQRHAERKPTPDGKNPLD